MQFSELSNEELRKLVNPDNPQLAAIITQAEQARVELADRERRESEMQRERERMQTARANDAGPIPDRRGIEMITGEAFARLNTAIRGSNIQRQPRALALFVSAMHFLLIGDMWRSAMRTLQDAGYFEAFDFHCDVLGRKRKLSEVSAWFGGGAVPPKLNRRGKRRGFLPSFLQS